MSRIVHGTPAGYRVQLKPLMRSGPLNCNIIGVITDTFLRLEKLVMDKSAKMYQQIEQHKGGN